MDPKRFAIGTVVGGATIFVVGYLIWNVALEYWNAAFVEAGVARESQLLWVNALSNVLAAALLTFTMERGGPSTIGGGVKIGAIVGFLVWSSVDLGFYAGTTIFDFTVIVLDPLLASVWYGIGGGVIAAVLERR